MFFLVVASTLVLVTDGQWLDTQECVGADCCHEADSELSRQFVCSMLAYLDMDPQLQMEGCRKHGHTCRVICQGRTHRQMMAAFQNCDTMHDKDTAMVDWYGCFFAALISGAAQAVTLSHMETTEPKEATGNFCQLWTQPGCPLCIAMRLGTNPCSFEGIEDVCPRVCKKCKCPPAEPAAFRAQALTCPSWNAAWGTTCDVTCPVDSSSQGQLQCVEGAWRGTLGNASCMSDCINTGLTLPAKGTQLELTGGGTCERMQHGERCFLSCEAGTSPSAWWECDDGVVNSSRHPDPPECLLDCGPPPLPESAAKFESCSNPVLENSGQRRLLDELHGTPRLARHLDDSIYVPQTVRSGSSCELSCVIPYTPSQQYFCWNGSYTVPECTFQLIETGWRWPVPSGDVISPLGGVYVDYNLDVIVAFEAEALGKMVSVCSTGGLGCPMENECFAQVPLEDTGRVSTRGHQLRVRLGQGTEALQIYGCEYRVSVPNFTVQAVVNRSVGNQAASWSYKLLPPPPKLVKLSVEPSYNKVDVIVQYDTTGTIRCMTTAPGVKPLQTEINGIDWFNSQTMADVPVRMTLENLAEFTDYDVHCQAVSSKGLSQSLFSVHDNSVRFKTQTRTPYARDVQVVQIDNTRVVLSILYSTECKVFCAAEQHSNRTFEKASMEAAVRATEPVEFHIEERELEIANLVPGMPTQILCRAVKDIGWRKYFQPWSDAWANVQELDTLAMTSTDLGYLNATGCELVPPFSPTTPIYACALPKGVPNAMVQLSAGVPLEAYSKLDCDGEWRNDCTKALQVEAGAPQTWQVNVKSQVGHVDTYVVVAMDKAKVVPREITPKTFPASHEAPKMTICAAAEADALPTDVSQVTAMLLPGNWNLTVHELHTGDNLTTCTCAGCNLEVLLEVRGAGRDLVVVLFISGFPGFTLDEPLRVHFESPKVTDVDPPIASMYEPTELIVRGANFGHSADVGATIHIEKTGAAISLPPSQWFGNCPKMILQIGEADVLAWDELTENKTDVHWAGAEFNGTYNLIAASRYRMSRVAQVEITPEEVKSLPEEVQNAGPNGPKTPVELSGNLRNTLIDRIGMCCYKRLKAVKLSEEEKPDKDRWWWKPPPKNRTLTVERLGRNMPELRLNGKAWDLFSREIRQVRVHFDGMKLGISDGWKLFYKDEYPGPRRGADRRLAQNTSRVDLYKLASAWTGGLPAQLGVLNKVGPSGRRMQEEKEPEEECQNNNKQLKQLLEELDIEIPGLGWLVTCGVVTSLEEDICFMLQFVCCKSCRDWKPTEEAVPVRLLFQYERCGDGVLVGEEQCDDSNLRNGDGCNFFCHVEEGWTCGKEGCKRVDGRAMPPRNQCGETTWIDDKTLRCTLSAGARWPLALRVDVHNQTSMPASWVQYAQPSITSLEAIESRNQTRIPILEFIGGQELRLTGRGLPPSNTVAQRTPVALVIGSSRLCGSLEVLSSSEARCLAAQAVSLDRLTDDPEVTIRVDEVSSEGVSLSRFGLPFRRPKVISMTPQSFNDTDLKLVELTTQHAGLPLHGTLHVSIGSANCTVTLHTSELVRCNLGYLPVGDWHVQMQLGSLDADSDTVVTSVPTLCPVGKKRVEVETSKCTACPPGRAEPDVNANFTCPKCRNAFYQNGSGMAFCSQCTQHTFSVGLRSSEQHCRCRKGFFHAYGDEVLAAKCSACERSRGFGWATSNWSIDCEDCTFRKPVKDPRLVPGFGPCSDECYGLACSPCPFGTVCFGNAAWPRVLPGFWTENVYSSDASTVQRCMPMKACLGDDGSGRMVCNKGYDGVRCGVCVLGYYKEHHDCVICPDNQWLWGLFFFIFFLMAVIFGVIPAQIVFMCRLLGIERPLPLVWRLACAAPQCCFSRCGRCCRSRSRQAQPGTGCSCSVAATMHLWAEEVRAAPLLRTLSMCLNFGQTCYAFSMLQRPAVAWPAASWELLSWTKLLTADVEFMKPDCIVPLPYFTKWVGKIFFPGGIVALLCCVTVYLSWSLRREMRSMPVEGRPSLWNAFCFTLALVIHVSLIWHLKVVLSPVDCNWCREGVTCLDEHTLVECWTDDPTWKAMMVISVIDFVCISGSFLVFLSILILYAWHKEEEFTVSRSGPGVSTRIGVSRFRSFTSFFVAGYRGTKQGGNVATFSWELLILYRKLALLLAAKFTTVHPVRGANLQLFVLLLSLVGQLTLRPYQHAVLNKVDGVLNLLQFFVLLSACQLTMGVGDTIGSLYTALNVASLYGGAALAMGISLWKLALAWKAETSGGKKAAAATTEQVSVVVPEVRCTQETQVCPADLSPCSGDLSPTSADLSPSDEDQRKDMTMQSTTITVCPVTGHTNL